MTVYRLEPDNDRFHNFALVDANRADLYHRAAGTPLGNSWVPPEVMPADTDEELALLAGHALLGIIPIVSERATATLADLLTTNGELLPLRFSHASYFAYNVTTV